LSSDDGSWGHIVGDLGRLEILEKVVNPNVVCPDPNLLEWEIFDTNIEDGTAWNKIVVDGIHIHVFVSVHALWNYPHFGGETTQEGTPRGGR